MTKIPDDSDPATYRGVDAHLSGRHPFEIFVLIFALIVGLPALLGLAPRPGSITEATTGITDFLWSFALVFGSAVALGGIFWKERATGLIAEQLGLAFVGGACFIYSVIAVYQLGLAALVPAGIIAGFALACAWQYRRIQKILNDVAALEVRQVNEGDV